MTIQLLTGDCRDVLATLPECSVHTVVTSPPYYGLRDYGTAQWDGGDAACDHVAGLARHDERTIRQIDADSGRRPNAATYESDARGVMQYRDTCGKCGARRIDRQLGLEATSEAYLAAMVQVFRAVRRVLRDDGTCWVNIGDSYAGGGPGTNSGLAAAAERCDGVKREHSGPRGKAQLRNSGMAKPKDLQMMPARLALALQADGWWVRSDIIWHKPGPMPESARDRPTSAHEHLFLLSKKPRYYFDLDAIKEPSGANCRNVWTIASYPFSGWIETSRQVRVAWDAAVDGKKRKASPDCPVHGDQPVQAPNAHGDAHADGSLSHIARNGVHLVQAPVDDCAPSDPLHTLMSEAQSSDLPLLERSSAATLHSSQSHRTDLDPSTSQPCSVSAETGAGTERTSEALEPAGSADHTLASNNGQGVSDDSPSNQTAPHSADTPSEQALSSAFDPSSCTCEWYIEKTEKTSHFATFPPALVERCIRAGTSERGCCAACGAPWVRIIEKAFLPTQDPTFPKAGQKGVDASNGWGDVPRGRVDATTTGWRASCQCQADVVPCTVLDPFVGSGTTALVADRLQRHAIGIDLSIDYAAMAQRRLEDDCPLFTSWAPAETDAQDERMRDLFSVAAD